MTRRRWRLRKRRGWPSALPCIMGSSWDARDRRYLARAMHESGRTIAVISETLGVTKADVREYLQPTVAPEFKDANDTRRIRNALSEGLCSDDILERLGISPDRFRKLTARAGLTYETRRNRKRRERRERVSRAYKDGVPVREIAARENMQVGNVYNYVGPKSLRGQSLVRNTPSAPSVLPKGRPPARLPASLPIHAVRRLYDEGLGLRLVAERLDINIQTAQKALRASFPDTTDAPLSDAHKDACRAGQRASWERRTAAAL